MDRRPDWELISRLFSTSELVFWTYHWDSRSLKLQNPAGEDCFATHFSAFFTDLVYARKFFAPQDFIPFKLFTQQIRDHQSAEAIIRFRDLKGRSFAIKLKGRILESNRLTAGYIHDLTGDLEKIHESVSGSTARPVMVPNSREKGNPPSAGMSPGLNSEAQNRIRSAQTIDEALHSILQHQIPQAATDLVGWLGPDRNSRKLRIHLITRTGGDPMQSPPLPVTALPGFQKTGDRGTYRIIEDLNQSDSLLDWAYLFPLGIRSYYAQPLYQRQRLQGTLYFGSFSAGHFTPVTVNAFRPCIELFRFWLRQPLNSR